MCICIVDMVSRVVTCVSVQAEAQSNMEAQHAASALEAQQAASEVALNPELFILNPES